MQIGKKVRAKLTKIYKTVDEELNNKSYTRYIQLTLKSYFFVI